MGKLTEALEKFTGRSCFETYRRCLDQERLSSLEYDDRERNFMARQGETARLDKARDVTSIAADWKGRDPAFKLFLDGSRRTFKILDMPIGSQVFPIVAGQVGVGVCNLGKADSPCNLIFKMILDVPNKISVQKGSRLIVET